MPLIDLTHTFAEPMPVYPGDPPVTLASTAEFNGCPLFQVGTGMHVGTHMDAPLHVFPAGASIAELPIDHFVGRGVLVDARGRATIDADLLASVDLRKGDMVLVVTGFSQSYASDSYYRDYPVLSEEFARVLVSAQVSVVGLDTPSPDREPFAIHRLLLGHGIFIIENLTNLERLLGAGTFEVIALPVKFKAEAAPTRVLARLSDE